MNQKEVYDNVYTNFPRYNSKDYEDQSKVDTIDEYVKRFSSGKILDAGCGVGNNLDRLFKAGYSIFGIEISKVCCDKYLQSLPFSNEDIVTHSLKGNKYDCIICTDVLEHISHEEIDVILTALQNMSSNAIIGIANHSDIYDGVELHTIQENEHWWEKKLKFFYNSVMLTSRIMKPFKFYFFECKN